jgi:N-acetylmuramoyl-L-alanine amidase
VAGLGSVAALAVAALAAQAPADDRLVLNSQMRVRVDAGRVILLEQQPSVPGPAAVVAVPLERLEDDLRALVLLSLFPKDRRDGGDWIHVARAGRIPTYDEGLWQVALWFTGQGERFEELGRANGLLGPELAAGQEVRIPAALLHPALVAGPRSDDGALEYGRDAQGEFAGYRLKAGEALYSSVVLRFTGRTAKEDVEALAAEIATRSGIRDITDIPIDWLVKIPFDVLEPEFLPRENPRRRLVESERAEAEAALAERPRPAARRRLEGVVVILDPGHGGRDIGTENHGVWEHDHTYDIAMRLKRRLEAGSGATVFLTLEDRETGTAPSAGDALERNHQGTLNTDPPFLPGSDGESSMGVNLRWYLANSILRRVVKAGTDPDRVVFLSIHADARHPALRGAMVYVPGAAYRAGTYGSSSAGYRRFREVREQPKISFTRKERLRSEAVSRRLADQIVKALRRDGLPVQDFKPVRERVIRGRGTWLPAVLRGNAVPTKLLIEVLNLTNPADAAMIGRAAQRERVALALASALEAHFGSAGRPAP